MEPQINRPLLERTTCGQPSDTAAALNSREQQKPEFGLGEALADLGGALPPCLPGFPPPHTYSQH